jgi:prevent-host-death family protein
MIRLCIYETVYLDMHMASYNVHQAKTNLSRLLEEAALGENVVIMRNGQPVARLVPYREPQRKKRQLGFAAGEVKYTEGWDRAMTAREIRGWFNER